MKKKEKSKKSPIKSKSVTLLIGTRKGAFLLRSDAAGRTWKLSDPIFLGHVVHHLIKDPRSKTLLMACKTGHLGPTVFRSLDGGKTWKEASTPPSFPKAPEGEKGRTVDHVFWLTPGHESQPGVWFAGTSPQGIFCSEDDGVTWKGVEGFNRHPMLEQWTGGEKDGTPDGPKLHSILIDPRDAAHMYIGCSSGGVFETLDGGRNWKPLNQGCASDFIPAENPEYGHDPHCVILHPLFPDILYQQNHCGIYRMSREKGRWERIGKNMPEKIGDIGFPIVIHPRDPNIAWVFPMDGTDVWPRTSPGGKPAVYQTSNGGQTWKCLDKGFPNKHAWMTVLRQAMTADDNPRINLYLGTTHGEIWAGTNEGRAWKCIARHLPEIYSVEIAK
ncbi:glycosyl hydrolase [bacterium]|nr:glycosyl hydrolase [bacterium]